MCSGIPLDGLLVWLREYPETGLVYIFVASVDTSGHLLKYTDRCHWLWCTHGWRTVKTHFTYKCSLVPRPLPDFISQPWRKTGWSPGIIGICILYFTDRKWWTQFVLTESTISGAWRSNDPRPSPDFSPRLRDKIWEWPGDEAIISAYSAFRHCLCVLTA